jgi:putative tryptophan/tyrosine transport system substrate-binding protein
LLRGRSSRAQQAERIRKIGVLVNLPADDPQAQARNATFLQALQELGWTVGRNVRIDYRWGAGNADNTRKFAVGIGRARTERHPGAR